MVVNDLASVIQTEDKVTIVINKEHAFKGIGRLTENEEMLLLLMYTNLVKSHKFE